MMSISLERFQKVPGQALSSHNLGQGRGPGRCIESRDTGDFCPNGEHAGKLGSEEDVLGDAKRLAERLLAHDKMYDCTRVATASCSLMHI